MFAVVLMLLAQAPPLKEDRFPDLPPLSDAARFGYDGKTCRKQLDRHRNHLSWVRRQQNLPESRMYGGGAKWQTWVENAAMRFKAWDLLDDVTYCASSYTEEKKRTSLLLLMELLGEEAYYAGRMPDPYPEMVYD